jgi:hypothetical protein
VHSTFGRYARKSLSALLCVAAFVAAGCHGNNLTSGYGIAWTTLTAEPSEFTTYIVTVDSVTLTGKNVGVITALATPEVIDFTQLNNVAELYAAASVPNDTYTSATITLDYTSAVIGVMVNGKPVQATVVDPTGAAVTTMSVTVNFDPGNPLIITPTYASTSALRLSLDFNLPASNSVDASVSPPKVVVRPFLTIGVQPSDTKLIRVRGPLINSSVGVQSYTVYVRPFYDEVDSLGSLSLFSQPKTIYTIDGISYVGPAGVTQLQQLSAGTTMTIAYTTFTPSVNNLPSPPAAAGTFYPVYVLAGSTVEDIYTEGLSGYVIARNGNTLTLRSSILFLNDDEIFTYPAFENTALVAQSGGDSQLIVGLNTAVTVDGTTASGLTADALSVGQYVSARGLYELPASGVTTLDATGDSSTNTGSVRIMSTQLWGTLVSSATGGVVMNVENINGWPASVYEFAGNGATAAQNPSAAAFAVNTGSLTLPAGVAAGDPLWINGIMSPFGSAPPDFNATAVNSEASVQVAGGAGTTPAPGNSSAPGAYGCGVGSQVCVPASLQVSWSTTGTIVPFTGLSVNGFSIDLTNTQLVSAVVRIGPQSIPLTSLPSSPQIVPNTTQPITTTYAPQYTVGNPTTATVTPTVVTSTTALYVYSGFPDFVTEVERSMTTASPALQFEARGVYDRSKNTFTATTANLVL